MAKGPTTAPASKAARKPLDDGRFKKRKQVQHSERGKGLKFSVEVYEVVSKFTPQTRIKYGPNPKQLGSKSHDRYAKYAKAKTIGEALELGAKPADLLWEYQREHYKVIGGPMSSQPNCLLSGEKRGVAEKVLSSFRGPSGFSLKMGQEKRRLCEKIAKEFGFDLDRLHSEADQTGNNESADVQTERTLADAAAERTLRNAAKARRKIKDEELLEVLQIWGFAQNETRLNVMPKGEKWVHSDTIGSLRLRTGGYRLTDPTVAYPNFVRLLCRWFADHQPEDIKCKCAFTGINVNANYAAEKHRDANNEGPSAIKAFGKFTGGTLRYWPKDRQRPKPPLSSLPASDAVVMDLRRKLTLFDGNCAHAVDKFTGERFSLVFFTTKGYQKIGEKDKAVMKKLGFQLPTPKLMATMKAAARDAYG
mmetsp:Transcript_105981/g.306526  ORF Transcript_105981/g.306526 Transcript_105981/m.306526 type:complete len:420 (-) Transcript_105981:103-1362(-)